MGEQAAYLRPNELNGLASSRIDLVFCVLERDAGGRPAENDFQLKMVCWWKIRDLVHRPRPLRLRYGRKEHRKVVVGPCTLRRGVRRPRRKCGHIH